MLSRLRHLEIQQHLDRHGAVRVSELARRFDVTEETIRRDLVVMEKENLLQRVHGGAIPLESPQQAPPYHLREVAQVEAKRSIARRALQEIEEGDILFLDGSTTAFQLARIFPDLRCTVLTHSEPIFRELSRRTQIELISTGGLYDRRSASFVGPLAEQILSTCQITKAFLGCKGLDLERGFSDASVRDMNLKRSVIQCSEQVYVIADETKFSVRSRYIFARPDEVFGVISDRNLSPSRQQALHHHGIACLQESTQTQLAS